MSSIFKVAKNDSATALSRHDPVRPMDRRSPSRVQASMQAVEVCSLPRSVWKIVSDMRGWPHVMGTRGTKAGHAPASSAYVSHVLDGCGVPPRMLRCTRLVDLVNTMDPKLVAAAFGMDPRA
jgi:hypothetical protein